MSIPISIFINSKKAFDNIALEIEKALSLKMKLISDDEGVKYVRRKCWICDCITKTEDDKLQKELSPDYIHVDDIPEIERLFKKCAFIDISWKNKYIHKMELSQFFEGILQRLHEASTT